MSYTDWAESILELFEETELFGEHGKVLEHWELGKKERERLKQRIVKELKEGVDAVCDACRADPKDAI